MAKITFCGAAGTVTGSCSLLEIDGAKVLVDCGLFQGNKSAVALNYEDFPFDPATLDCLVLTHAHIDHSGLVPKLVANGFNGPIYATKATAELLEFLLKDGAAIQESNTKRKNKYRVRKGLPTLEPLYTKQDADAALELVKNVQYEKWFTPVEGVEVQYWNAGHILGSASAEMKVKDGEKNLKMLFSGDLGPDEKVFHPEPDAPEGFDYIICESTYGNRERPPYTLKERRQTLLEEVELGLSRGGNVVIPSFAVERSQELLHDIGVLIEEGNFPNATVYLDSPLAKKVTQVFIKHAHTLDDLGLNPDQLFQSDRFRLIQSVDESKKLNEVQSGAIIISASGMCEAGRIQHHLKANIWREQCTVLLVGYQSPGTLGHIIQSGADKVRIHGQEFIVKADIRRIGNYSAHADQVELIDWVIERSPIRRGLFLNHGEDDARQEMKNLLIDKGIDGEKIFLPQIEECFELTSTKTESQGRVEKPRITQPIQECDWNNHFVTFQMELGEILRSDLSCEEKESLIEKLKAVISK